MHQKWTEYFCHPHTGAPLQLVAEEIANGEVITGRLEAADGTVFPIIRGIPCFVPEELLKDVVDIAPPTAEVQTGRSFGDKWRTERNRQLGNTEADKKDLTEQFLAMLGCDNHNDLYELFEDAEMCLNAGCGVAWSEYLFNVNSKTKRFAADLSLAVEVAYERTRELDNVVVLQGNLFELPFPDNSFDIVFADGVVHHTPEPKGAVLRLCDYLKPGGLLGIYIYKVKPFLRELADREIRAITTEMTFEECLEFSSQMSALGKALQQFTTLLVVEEDIPLLGIEKGTYNLQKFIYDHFVKCFYNGKLGREASDLVNVDWYHPAYASHHTEKEVREWLAEGGLHEVKCVQPLGWEHSGFFFSGRKMG